MNALKIASQEEGPGKKMIQQLLKQMNDGELSFSTLNDVIEAADRQSGVASPVEPAVMAKK